MPLKPKTSMTLPQAFVPGDAGGNPAIRNAIHEVGAAVVASAAFAAGGGKVGLVDPNCGGTSFETIPTDANPGGGMPVSRSTRLRNSRD